MEQSVYFVSFTRYTYCPITTGKWAVTYKGCGVEMTFLSLSLFVLSLSQYPIPKYKEVQQFRLSHIPLSSSFSHFLPWLSDNFAVVIWNTLYLVTEGVESNTFVIVCYCYWYWCKPGLSVTVRRVLHRQRRTGSDEGGAAPDPRVQRGLGQAQHETQMGLSAEFSRPCHATVSSGDLPITSSILRFEGKVFV